jgi:transcriptional regulator with XRE-family HTH domain
MAARDYTPPPDSSFVDGTDEVDALLAEPEIAAFIEAERPAREAMNRAFKMNLATVRKAAELTQAELAAALGYDVSSITKLEGRDNLMLATLAKYLDAAGVDAAAIVVTVKGQRFEFDLQAQQSETPPVDEPANHKSAA